MLQVKQTTNHTMIEFNVNIFILFILIKLSCGSHGSPANLHILKPKFLDKLSCVLLLIYEDLITLLFDLESKKIVELSHHTHFKLFLHAWFKIFIKIFISISKNDIINIYLYNQDIFIYMLYKQCSINFVFNKTI